MNDIALVTHKNLNTSITRKSADTPFSDKIPFIRSLILDSVEPETIKKIYLFGSYVYGNPNQKSDIDLCVVIENNQEDSKIYLKIARSLFINNIIPADILLYKESEFIDLSKSEGIEKTILLNGKTIYG